MTERCLALCLDAPMQSWGLRGRATIRDTAAEPTKAGVVGLLCCALGVPRDDEPTIAELAGLRLGVRVDREGIVERDYHTVQQVPTTSGRGHRTVESHRYYLADALFLVVLYGATNLVETVAAALRRPTWPMYLGRRAYVPTRPLLVDLPDPAGAVPSASHDRVGGHCAAPPGDHTVVRTGLGLVDGSLESVLATHPWLEERPRTRESAWRNPERPPLRTMVDCEARDPLAEMRYDHPICYVRDRRSYRARTVRQDHIPLTDSMIGTEVQTPCS